ncbi:MAG: hypothetical protein COB09_02615 [Thalassobium sp.]|nr:MAG: hypothetical protein COB09_02615 [Thalassobium sp.]
MQLDNITLPTQMYWDNEQDFKPFAYSKQRAVNGALDIQVQPLHYGRPIKLINGWIRRADLDALRALENEPAVKRVLTLVNPQTFTVLFDLEAGGIQATPLDKCSVPDPDDLFDLTLNFITVEPDP